jgi:carbon monoxide dehydrogenase subunit G
VELDNSFEVAAAPHDVYAFLLDVNRIAGCVPGAELGEVVDPDTFNGRVKIRVGPITVAYAGTARITARDEEAHRAELEAEGRETTGPGSARAHAVMTVTEVGGGSRVEIHTDYQVAGRVAQFGGGVMEDVSRRLVTQMAACIKQQLEGPPPPGAGTPGSEASGDASSAEATAPAPAKPINAFSLFLAVLWDRLRRVLGARPAQT